MDKTILVTGASGKLGRFMSARLVEEGYVVHALVKSKERSLMLPPGTVPFLGDIVDKKQLEKACDGADAVMHFAAIVSEYKYTTEQILKTNVVGTRNLLDVCAECGVKRFLFTSTIDVYGRARKERLTEESELKPTDKYGYSKMLAEQVVKEESDEVKYTILRLATAYGPGLEHSFFKILRLIKAGKAYVVGRGDNNLSLIHVADVAQAFLLSLQSKAAEGRVYHFSDGEDHTLKQLMDLSAEMLGVPKPTKQINELLLNVMARSRNIDSDELRFLTSNRKLDISKAAKELGYKPKVNIRKGTQELIAAFNEAEKHHATRSIL
ncbi:MAG: NAD(P)-dependent oxidoreductase [Candidatus Micrarchaeaceae archaeon]